MDALQHLIISLVDLLGVTDAVSIKHLYLEIALVLVSRRVLCEPFIDSVQMLVVSVGSCV